MQPFIWHLQGFYKWESLLEQVENLIQIFETGILRVVQFYSAASDYNYHSQHPKPIFSIKEIPLRLLPSEPKLM